MSDDVAGGDLLPGDAVVVERLLGQPGRFDEVAEGVPHELAPVQVVRVVFEDASRSSPISSGILTVSVPLALPEAYARWTRSVPRTSTRPAFPLDGTLVVRERAESRDALDWVEVERDAGGAVEQRAGWSLVR